DKATGKPVSGIRLVVEEADALDKPRPLFPRRGTSGEDGTFQIGALAPGKYALKPEVNAEGALDVIIDKTEVAVKAGQVIEGLQLKVSSGGVMEVTVTDGASGEQLSGVLIGMRDAQGEWLSGYVGKSGTGIVRLPPGDYSLQSVSKRGYVARYLSRTVRLKERDRVSIAVKMEPASQ
ncbi:MAG: MSCRAMM family protein, partial [Planctomycetota bacterium]